MNTNQLNLQDACAAPGVFETMPMEKILQIPPGHGSLFPRGVFSDKGIGHGGGWVTDGTWAIRGRVNPDSPLVGPFAPETLAEEIETFAKPTGWMWEIRRISNNTYGPVAPLTEILQEATPVTGDEEMVKYLNDKIVNYALCNVPALQWFHGQWNSWKMGPAYGVVQGIVVMLLMPMRQP